MEAVVSWVPCVSEKSTRLCCLHFFRLLEAPCVRGRIYGGFCNISCQWRKDICSLWSIPTVTLSGIEFMLFKFLNKPCPIVFLHPVIPLVSNGIMQNIWLPLWHCITTVISYYILPTAKRSQPCAFIRPSSHETFLLSFSHSIGKMNL